MERIIANKRRLSHCFVLGLIIAVLAMTFSMQVIAKEKKQVNQPDTEKKLNEQENKEDSKMRTMKHLHNITGTRRKKGVFASIRRFIFGADALVEFNKPFGIGIDKSSGKIYVTDTVKNEILMFKSDGSYVKKFGTRRLENPTGIDVVKGKIYVSNSTKHRITVFNKKGKYIKDFGFVEDPENEKRLKRPTGLTIDEKRKRVYVVDTKGHSIKVYDLEGKFLKAFGERGGGKAEFNYPIAIHVDKEGKLYVGDTLNYRVQILNKKGKFIRQFGGPGQTLGSLPRPKGITTDQQGRIYVTDGYLQVIQVFSPKGEMLFFFGRPGQYNNQFQLPAEIEIDNRERIHIIDTMNRRVQVLKFKKNKSKSNKDKE